MVLNVLGSRLEPLEVPEVRNILQCQGSVPDKWPLCHSMTCMNISELDEYFDTKPFVNDPSCLGALSQVGGSPLVGDSPCLGLCPWLRLTSQSSISRRWMNILTPNLLLMIFYVLGSLMEALAMLGAPTLLGALPLLVYRLFTEYFECQGIL